MPFRKPPRLEPIPAENCVFCFGTGNCQSCQGTGSKWCYLCDGAGDVPVDPSNPYFRQECSNCRGAQTEPCSVCCGLGSGVEPGQCTICKGTGKQ